VTSLQVRTDDRRGKAGTLRRSPKISRATTTGWAFCLPYLALFAVLGLMPVLYSIYETLVKSPVPGGGGTGSAYPRVFSDFRFMPAVEHVGVFLAIYLPAMVFGVVILALFVSNNDLRTGAAIRLAFILPGTVVGSAGVLLWYIMISPAHSPFAAALHHLGATSDAAAFKDSHLVFIFATIAFMTGFGQWVVILYGALQAVPGDLIEAAELDGCTATKLAVRIKLPLISKYVVYMLILAFASGVQIFVEPQLLYTITETAASPWWSLNQLGLTFAFQNGDFPSAAVMSVLLLVLCIMAALIVILKTDFFTTEATE
jgi:multiple sugar transport system permease protein